MLLGCIADDLTGATDLALMLTRSGMRTIQVMGVPERAGDLSGADAVVVALKSRTNPAEEAVAWSLAAAERLQQAGARQLFFKYCSTFNSTDRGNIGPVAEALIEKLGAPLAIVCPAFPANKRSVYMGNLFVGEVPLAESPMKDHPLTPMRDSNLVRVLQRQTRLKVGLVPFGIVEQGAGAIAAAFEKAIAAGQRFVVVDAVTDRHLIDMGTAAAGMALITGGSGVAMGLPANFVRQGQMKAVSPPQTLAAPKGRTGILAGSCSEATRGQVKAAIEAGLPVRRIDPLDVAERRLTAEQVLAWIAAQEAGKPFLVYSSDDPKGVAAVQEKLGREAAGAVVEHLLADVARGLGALGITRLIVAGGETSGAVVGALGVTAIEIGPEIDPGVPWTLSRGDPAFALALKSGNFGAPDFFLKAWSLLS